MASKQAPNNDFAPAWLKIPDSDAPKSAHLKHSSIDQKDLHGTRPARRDDYYNGHGRFPVGQDYNYHPLQRQRSFDYYDERRFSPQKFRHHSVDDGYYNNNYGPGPYPYYNGYDFEKYGNQYRSQPIMGKYQHPNSRFNGGQVNGGYPPYFEGSYPYPYGGDNAFNGYANGSPGGNYSLRPGTGLGAKRGHSDKPNHNSKSGDKTDLHSPDTGSAASKKGSIEEEFPSLNGDAETQNKPEKVHMNSNGVWEKPMSNKKTKSNLTVVKSDGLPREPAPSKQSVAMYKALIPNKTSLTRKSSKDTRQPNGIKDLPNGSSKLSPGGIAHYKLLKDSTNKGREVSSTPPMEILNSKQHIIQPRILTDKKSHFLKTLKNDRSGRVSDGKLNEGKSEEQGDENEVVNGVHNLSVSPCEHLLSSSLEEEQRLLREMGWNEADDEEYVITEDDLKQFQEISKEIKAKKNGITRPQPPTTFSPQHLLHLYQPSLHELNNETMSDSDSIGIDSD